MKNILRILLAMFVLLSVNYGFAFSKKDVVVTKNGNITNIQHKQDPFYLGEQYYTMPAEKRVQFMNKALKTPETTLPIYYIYFAEDVYPKDKDTAAFLFMLGYYLSVQDVSLCTDKTAYGAISGLGFIAPYSAAYVSKLSSEKMEQLKNKVFTTEKTLTKRPDPIWICYHGMDSFTGEVKTLPKSEYDKVRNEVREKFKQNK